MPAPQAPDVVCPAGLMVPGRRLAQATVAAGVLADARARLNAPPGATTGGQL
ncbi:MAG: hypothetical protein ACP5VR_11260 [Acidimicrobiales bacterium]